TGRLLLSGMSGQKSSWMDTPIESTYKIPEELPSAPAESIAMDQESLDPPVDEATVPTKSPHVNLPDRSAVTSARYQEKRFCGQCDVSVGGDGIFALNKYWHPEHFVCERCKRAISVQFSV
ncbi:hypothetical protein PENTCL1PPCAC_30530, partial [Pristionchus entomophagus]